MSLQQQPDTPQQPEITTTTTTPTPIINNIPLPTTVTINNPVTSPLPINNNNINNNETANANPDTQPTVAVSEQPLNLTQQQLDEAMRIAQHRWQQRTQQAETPHHTNPFNISAQTLIDIKRQLGQLMHAGLINNNNNLDDALPNHARPNHARPNHARANNTPADQTPVNHAPPSRIRQAFIPETGRFFNNDDDDEEDDDNKNNNEEAESADLYHRFNTRLP